MEETSLKTLMLMFKNRDPSVESLLPEELSLLIGSFLPSQNTSIRAQALVFLSKFVSDVRQKYSSSSNPDIATSALVRAFSGPIEARLADTQERATLSAILFLVALFQVDWISACEIFSRDGLVDAIMDTHDVYHASRSIPVAVASLLSHASGHKECRALTVVPQVKDWLNKSMKQTNDPALQAASAVALVKLTRGSEMDAESSNMDGISVASNKGSRNTHDPEAEDRLVALIKNIVITEDRTSSPTLDAVEGLAYLTVQSKVKETISTDVTFLKNLMDLVPRRPSAPSFPASHTARSAGQDLNLGLSYGIASILSNLCAYKPQLSDEEQQIQRLRHMTKTPGAGAKFSNDGTTACDQDKLDDENHVQIRGRRLMDAGVAETLTAIIKGLGGGEAKTRSTAVHRTVAKTFLSLIEDKSNRGKILQGGGPKALLNIIYASIAELLPSDLNSKKYVDALEPIDLLAIQALAKLSITSPPAAVFGPTQDSYIDAIRPFAVLLTHTSASLLQRFEAVMALTNIASVSPESAERVSSFRFGRETNAGDGATIGDIVKYVETLLLDSNTMLRRASTELVCNLVGGAESSFDYFGGMAGSNAKSRLQIIVALSDVEDLATRLAASGALAGLTASPHACLNLATLEMERHRVLPTLVELISPDISQEYREEPQEEDEEFSANDVTSDPGLVHRGVVCVHNLFANLDGKDQRRSMSLEAEKSGLVRALIQTIKLSPGDAAVLGSAAEVLKWIAQAGVKLPL